MKIFLKTQKSKTKKNRNNFFIHKCCNEIIKTNYFHELTQLNNKKCLISIVTFVIYMDKKHK